MASINNSPTHNEQEESHIIKCADNVFKNYLDMPVWQLRHLQVSRYIDSHKIKRVLDIGCAQGTLINRLSRSSSIEYLVGFDCDDTVLEKAEMNVEPELMQDSIGFTRKNPLIVELYNLNAFEELPLQKFKSIQLVTMIQFIQHVQQQSLPELCKQVFERISPNYVIITTPNQEFNVHFNFKIGQMRHPQHLYQWTREQFRQFCQRVSGKYQYQYEMFGVGEHISNDQYGFCSQGAFFTRLKPKQNIHSFDQSSNRNIINPIKQIRYPFWKDTLNNRIEGEIRNILLNNNYQSPQEIAQLFKLSKIGKKMQENQQNIQEEKLETIDEHFIIRWVKNMKYCAYDAERNQVYYQYEESMQQQQYQFEEQPENNEQWRIS